MSIEAYTAYRRASRRRSSRSSFNPLRSIENEGELTDDINALDTTDLEDVGVKIRTEAFTDLYTVEAELGRGKFATVKKCRCNTTGEVFAAKIQRKRRKGVDARQELIHEIRMLALCKIHPRIIGLKEVLENRHEIIIITNFAEGGELYRHMESCEEGFSEAMVRQLLRYTLEGLVFLHQRNIVHLDIKPQNLLLAGPSLTSEVLLCDLGLSRTVSQDKDVREIVGTPDFVAPEVLNYEPISTAVDMWSVGVLTYMLLSGCSPFAGADKMETFSNITLAQVDFPEELFKHTSESARDLVRKLLKRNPSGRLTASECLDHPWMLEDDSEGSISEGHSQVSSSLSTEASDDSLTEKQDRQKVCDDHSVDTGSVSSGEGCGQCNNDQCVVGCRDIKTGGEEAEDNVQLSLENGDQVSSLTHQPSELNQNEQQQSEPSLNEQSSEITDNEKSSSHIEQSSQITDLDLSQPSDSSTSPVLLTEECMRTTVHMDPVRCEETRAYVHCVSECEVLPPLIEECTDQSQDDPHTEIPDTCTETQQLLEKSIEARLVDKCTETRPFLHLVSECEVLPPLIEECEDLVPLSKAQKDLCNARRVQQSPLSSPVGCRRALAPSPETVLETEPIKKHARRRGDGEAMVTAIKVQSTGLLDLEVHTDTNAVVCKRGASVRRTPLTGVPHTKTLVTFYENLLHHS